MQITNQDSDNEPEESSMTNQDENAVHSSIRNARRRAQTKKRNACLQSLLNGWRMCCNERAGLTGNRQTQQDIFDSFAGKEEENGAGDAAEKVREPDWLAKRAILLAAKNID